MRKTTILVLMALLLLVSCATKPEKKVGNPADLYVEGVDLMKKKQYDKAKEKFSTIREEYPFDSLALVATVKLADIYVERKEYVLAAGIYEEFFRAHPDDENIPYVLSRVAFCYEKLSLSLDRDQDYTVKAIERVTFLKNRYPLSTYAADADARLANLTAKLAARELYVGEFYCRTFQYNAAILRLNYFLKTYPGAKGTDLALFYLTMAHRDLGNQAKSDQYAEMLRAQFPKSLYARARTRERKTLQLAKAGVPSSYDQREGRKIDLRPQLAQADDRKKTKEEDLAFFDESKPIDIVSDGMEGFEKGRLVLFKGSVVARQEDLYIFADTMEAYTNEESNEIDKAVAKGNVKIVKKDRTATANEASFDNKTRVMTLKGNVVVFSGADRLTGEVVTYYVGEDRIVVEGEKEKKARITITPR
jgi:outer membrane protein assembly factor BamD